MKRTAIQLRARDIAREILELSSASSDGPEKAYVEKLVDRKQHSLARIFYRYWNAKHRYAGRLTMGMPRRVL